MTKIQFLPTDYKPPRATGAYMKLEDGENKIRILSQPILGWEDWDNKKPVRFRYENKPDRSLDPAKPVKHFWAFIVWNYSAEQIQIYQVNQATIRNSIQALCEDSDWGAPYFYDIKIVKKGEGKDTEYLVNPLPHKPIAKHIEQAFKDRPIYLDALYDNLDPFSNEWKKPTPGVFTMGDVKQDTLTISENQACELAELLANCLPAYQKKLLDSLKASTPPIANLANLPISMYQRVYEAISKNVEQVA